MRTYRRANKENATAAVLPPLSQPRSVTGSTKPLNAVNNAEEVLKKHGVNKVWSHKVSTKQQPGGQSPEHAEAPLTATLFPQTLGTDSEHYNRIAALKEEVKTIKKNNHKQGQGAGPRVQKQACCAGCRRRPSLGH